MFAVQKAEADRNESDAEGYCERGRSVHGFGLLLSEREQIGLDERKTRKRIEEAAKKLDYRPNRLARSLRTGKTRSIGMLVGNISDSYFGHLAEEVLEAARKRDYSLVLAVSKHENEERENALEFLMRNQIDALLTCSSLVNLPEAKNLKKKRDSCRSFWLP